MGQTRPRKATNVFELLLNNRLALKRFKMAREKAVSNLETTFTYEKNVIDVKYAKYMIEYVENQYGR